MEMALEYLMHDKTGQMWKAGLQKGESIGFRKGESRGVKKGIDNSRKIYDYLERHGRLSEYRQTLESQERMEKLLKEIGICQTDSGALCLQRQTNTASHPGVFRRRPSSAALYNQGTRRSFHMEETEKTTAPEAAETTEASMGKHAHHGHHGHPHHMGHGCPHGHHGHKPGHGKCSLNEFPADSLMGLMYAYGHRFHHTKKPDMTEENFFGALTPEEKTQLAALLTKAKDGWKKPEKPAEPESGDHEAESAE